MEQEANGLSINFFFNCNLLSCPLNNNNNNKILERVLFRTGKRS